MNSDSKKRWGSKEAQEYAQTIVRQGRSGNGYNVQGSPFAVTERGLMDLRGIVFPEGTELRRVRLANADLTAAVLGRAWIELCEFKSVIFERSCLQNVADHRNAFSHCHFFRTDFRDSHLGYSGSRYTECCFEQVDFRRTGFVRPEFDDCRFSECRFEGVDFNGSSFVNCEFHGTVGGAWFRGGFPLPSDNDQYGNPRENKMQGVSFKDARLLDVTFSDHCELGSVVCPADGRHSVFDRWPKRIRHLLEVSRSWPETEKAVAELFFRSSELHAKNQDWYLLGLDGLIQHFGEDSACKLWEGLHGLK